MAQSSTPTVLEKIIAVKQQEVEENKSKIPTEVIESLVAEQTDFTRGFYNRLYEKAIKKQNAVIAEIKKASPSKGIIREDFDPIAIAKSYEEHGATCLSILTDRQFFKGDESYLDAARENTSLPVLRKDFIIDAYQIFESRAMGADCILLIAACLSHQQMRELTLLAYDLGMDVLVEVHNMAELDKTAGLPIRMLGINNRNLHDFSVDLSITVDLASQVPEEVLIVTESGILNKTDVSIMNASDIYTFLVGETLMRHDSPGAKLQELFYD